LIKQNFMKRTGEGGQSFPLVHLSGLQAAGDIFQSSVPDRVHQEEGESLFAASQLHPGHTPTMAHDLSETQQCQCQSLKKTLLALTAAMKRALSGSLTT
jgi:hypothetical protein